MSIWTILYGASDIYYLEIRTNEIQEHCNDSLVHCTYVRVASSLSLTLFESNQALMTFLVHWYALFLPSRDLYLMIVQFLRSQNLPPYVPSKSLSLVFLCE